MAKKSKSEASAHRKVTKKRTSIGKSKRTRIKNKSKRRHNGGSKRK